MQSLAERLANLSPSDRAFALSKLTGYEGNALLYNWRGFMARPNQLAPPGNWDTWLVLAGRGFGKTKTGAEWVREEVDSGRARRIALVAETSADARDVMVEGDSGILACYPEGERPIYQSSLRRVTWPNGAVATLYNAVEPDQLRGPQHDCAWCDEMAKWRYVRETFDQLQFGLRIGAKPRQIITTTPRPIDIVRELVKQSGNGSVHVTRGSTYDNRSNLAPSFFSKIIQKYEGARIGRQELNAEILDDVPGALWSREIIERHRRNEMPKLRRIVIAVDPAITSGDEADEHGIVVCGVDQDQRGWVLEDASIRGTPMEWGKRAIAKFDEYDADNIVIEVNQGGEMCSHVLRSIRSNVPLTMVRASRGKHVRAEPISSMYEQGRISHLGMFAELEDQMVLMTPDGFIGERSPDRLDAMVWGFTALFPAIVTIPQREERYDDDSERGRSEASGY